MLETLKYLTGFTGPSGYGSKSTAEQVMEATPDLSSITAIVTGATSGIGAETARVLAKHGAKLILPTRNLKVAEETKRYIISEFPTSEIIVMPLDLSSLSSVQEFAYDFQSLNLPLNLLINNAGIYSYDYAISKDDIEMTFATNYLGHFLLTKLLLKTMIKTSQASGTEGRIVNLSSSSHSWFKGDIIDYLELVRKDGRHYNATHAYALSKLANILHAKALTERLKVLKNLEIIFEKIEANVTVNCLHPGTVKTRLNRQREGHLLDWIFCITSKFLKTIPQAAATSCYVATHPKLLGISGKYFMDSNEASTSRLGSDANEAVRLWTFSESIIAEKLEIH